jgi:DNA polymerase-3 subunit delta'
VEGARTRGQAAALAAVEAMVRGGSAPHAILLFGPEGVGKTTLALDLAAGLLCEADPDARPCRACRACRMVEHSGHPDLHRLGPAGPGRQVVIGGPDAKYRGVRDLIAELALMPVEGGARIAIVEAADRMNEDAQAALLKTLEEPPAGVVIVLCADQETRLLPTVRSRCARLRLGLLGPRDIEAIVDDHGLADPPLAARLGRLAAGRPGLALAYARNPETVLIRAELSRILLDLTDEGPAARLAAVRAAVPRAMVLAAALSPEDTDASGTDDGEDMADGGADQVRAVPAAQRRRAAELLVALWSDVARDLALVGSGGARSIRDTVILDELTGLAPTIEPGAVARFLDRAARTAELLASNGSPELLLDALVLGWPRRRSAA